MARTLSEQCPGQEWGGAAGGHVGAGSGGAGGAAGGKGLKMIKNVSNVRFGAVAAAPGVSPDPEPGLGLCCRCRGGERGRPGLRLSSEGLSGPWWGTARLEGTLRILSLLRLQNVPKMSNFLIVRVKPSFVV